MRAAIYARISDDREGAGLGVERQEKDCRALAHSLGWDVTSVYTDNDLSAYRRRTRPGYNQLLADLGAGRVDALVTWHNDRLHRNSRELEDFIDLVETAGAAVQTVKAGKYDLTTPSGRMSARILGAVAQYESEHKADRQRRKALELAEAGKVGNGGNRPFGYAPDRVTIVEEEAAVLRDLYAKVLAGRALRSLVRELGEQGVRTTMGKPWSQQGLRYNLLSGRNAGLREHHRQIMGPAVWPPIVDRDTWERARAILTTNRGKGHDGARKYLLTGFMFCAAPMLTDPTYVCGNRLRPIRTSQQQRFGCVKEIEQGCGRILVVYGPAEEWVVKAVLARLERDADLTPPLPGDPTEQLLARIAADEAQLRALAEAFADEPDANPLELRAAGARIRKRIDQTRTEIAQAAVTLRVAEPARVRDDWLAGRYDLAQKRAVLGRLVERITVAPAQRGRNRFDPERLDIIWR